MTRERKALIGCIAAAGIALAALGIFYIVAGVKDADRYSSMLGIFPAVVGLGVSIYSAVLTRRSLDRRGTLDLVRNSMIDVDVSGQVIQGQNVSRGSDISPSMAECGNSGTVRNEIRNATIGGSAIQGADISLAASPLEGTSRFGARSRRRKIGPTA